MRTISSGRSKSRLCLNTWSPFQTSCTSNHLDESTYIASLKLLGSTPWSGSSLPSSRSRSYLTGSLEILSYLLERIFFQLAVWVWLLQYKEWVFLESSRVLWSRLFYWIKTPLRRWRLLKLTSLFLWYNRSNIQIVLWISQNSTNWYTVQFVFHTRNQGIPIYWGNNIWEVFLSIFDVVFYGCSTSPQFQAQFLAI